MTPVSFLVRVWSVHRVGSYVNLSFRKPDWPEGRLAQEFVRVGPTMRRAIQTALRKYTCTEFEVYFCPNSFKTAQRRTAQGNWTPYGWADLDNVDPRGLDTVPAVAWRTSPGNYHALWLYRRRMSPLKANRVNERLYTEVRGDKGTWEFTRLLRVPGTINNKRDSYRVRLLWYDTKKKLRVPRIDLGGSQQIGEQADWAKLLRQYRHQMPGEVYKLLKQSSTGNKDRSRIEFKIWAGLLGAGIDFFDAMTLVKHSVWNKYRERQDQDKYLMRTAQRALAKQFRVASNTLKNLGTEDEEEDEEEGFASIEDLPTEQVKWLWYPYIPAGEVTIMEGDPKKQKSWLSLKIAAAVAMGEPLYGTHRAVHGRVFIMSLEDDWKRVIKPRLLRMGVTREGLSNIYKYEKLVSLDEAGFDTLAEQIKRLRPKLVIIDPIQAFTTDTDSSKMNEVRRNMNALKLLGHEYGCAIMVIRHFRKGGGGKYDAGHGSVDFIAAARSTLAIEVDPDEPIKKRLMVHSLSSYSLPGQTIAFEVQGLTERLVWLGYSEWTADDLQSIRTSANVREDKRVKCKEWILRRLNDGAETWASLLESAKAYLGDVSEHTLRNARAELVREGLIRKVKQGKKYLWEPIEKNG